MNVANINALFSTALYSSVHAPWNHYGGTMELSPDLGLVHAP